jgi:hypothetical protein
MDAVLAHLRLDQQRYRPSFGQPRQRASRTEDQVADTADVDHRRTVGQRIDAAAQLGDHEAARASRSADWR